MSARKFRNSWWVDFQFNGIRYRKRSPVNTEPDARMYESLLRQRLLRGEPVLSKPDAAPTFAEFAQEWLDTYVRTHNKPSVQNGSRQVITAHLLPTFGSKRLDCIKRADIEKFRLHKLQDGLAAKTVNTHVGVLMKCLRTAVDWEKLAACPSVKPLKTTTPPFDFLTTDESERLIAAAASEPHYHSMVLVALRTGMRLGELLALAWEDMSFENRTITVCRSITRGVVGTPKSHKIRHIPMTDDVYSTLSQMRRASGKVWPGRGGTFHDYKAVYAALDRVSQRAGVRHIGWHVLRHSFASQLAAAGVPVMAIKDLLGHSDINMTMRYSHMSPSVLRSAVAVLGQPDRTSWPNGNPTTSAPPRPSTTAVHLAQT
jgi:integrase